MGVSPIRVQGTRSEPVRDAVRRTIQKGYDANRVTMMKRILERPKMRRSRPPDPLPLDPRDPDVVRAKARLYAATARERRPRPTS
jgi:hypothetical protein